MEAINTTTISRAEAMTMQDKQPTVPRWSVFTQNSMCTSEQKPSLSHAQRWMRQEGTSAQQRAAMHNAITLKTVTKMCDICTKRAFSCLQEISRLFQICARLPCSLELIVVPQHQKDVGTRTLIQQHRHEGNLFAPDNRFRSSIESPDGCCHPKNEFQMSKIGTENDAHSRQQR